MYLDYAASTPVLPQVKSKAIELLECYGNPSSIHDEGINAHNVIENTKDIISDKLNCMASEIYFTSGATMSNNIAIQGYLRKHPDSIFITSTIEHNDIMLISEWLKDVVYISVDSNGYLNKSELEMVLEKNKDKNVLCSFQMANSETGVIQDIKEISKIVHCYNGILHTDATQYIPYYEVNVAALGIDMLSMSGQKIGCIKGTGILYVKESIELSPIIFGEQGLIGGTENVIGIGCLGEAFKYIDYDISNTICRRDEFINQLNGELIGSHFNRLPNNIYMMFKGVSSEQLQYVLNESGIYVSGGSACSSYSEKPSHVVLAMGYTEDEAASCIRLTIPKNISSIEVSQISNIINNNYRLLKG